MKNCIDLSVVVDVCCCWWLVGYGINNQQGLQIPIIQHSVTSVLEVAEDFKLSLWSYKCTNLFEKLKLTGHTPVSRACHSLDVSITTGTFTNNHCLFAALVLMHQFHYWHAFSVLEQIHLFQTKNMNITCSTARL